MPQPSNRDQLLKGAIKCLETKGFARTTARDIAAASGANLASIGYHFGSKEALLNEAMIRLFAKRNRRVGEGASGVDDDATPLERLRATFVAAGDVLKRPRPLFVSFVEAIAQAGRSKDLQEPLADYYRRARRATADAIRSMFESAGGEFEGDADAMAVVLLALFDGLVLQWLLEPDAVPPFDDLMDALVNTMSLALEQEAARV